MKGIAKELHQKLVRERCRRDMLPLANCASGRCFVIGSGPSLRAEDLDMLVDEVTFASNRIYGIFGRTEWRPTYYASQDDGVLLEICDALPGVSCEVGTMILSGNVMRRYPRRLKKRKNVKFMYIETTPEGKRRFDADVPSGIHNGINISYTLIELAVFIGYREIYLLGIDHSYVTKKNEVGQTVLDGNSRSNYFEGIAPLKYEAKVSTDDMEHVMDASTAAYHNAKEYADSHGIRIMNATRGGCLEVFERVDFDSIVGLGRSD